MSAIANAAALLFIFHHDLLLWLRTTKMWAVLSSWTFSQKLEQVSVAFMVSNNGSPSSYFRMRVAARSFWTFLQQDGCWVHQFSSVSVPLETNCSGSKWSLCEGAHYPSFWWIATNTLADAGQLVMLKETGSDLNKSLELCNYCILLGMFTQIHNVSYFRLYDTAS